MLQIDDKIISLEIFKQHFACDLNTCAGICCVHGDSGAPVALHEVKTLQHEYPNFGYAMTPQGRERVDECGVAHYDADNDLVTPLLNQSEECAYSYFDQNNTCLCAIEKAYKEQKTTFRKPISCHLYPIRIKQIGDNIALNYDRWHICECARARGKELQTPVFRFLQEALTRRFGAEFYQQLEQVYAHL